MAAGGHKSKDKMDEKQKARFLSLYCMVLADDIVDAKELEALYRIGRVNYKLKPEEINKMIVGAGTSVPTFESFDDKVELLYQMAEIAWADGKIEDTERNLMEKYALRFGFIEENVPAIIDFLLENAKGGVPVQNVIKKIKAS